MDEIVERGDHFVDWRDGIPGVEPIKVDIVSLQAAERSFEGTIDIFAAIAAGIWISRLGVERELGGEDGAIAELLVGDEIPDQLLAVAAGIAIGGIDEISAEVDVAIENGVCHRLLRTPAPFRTERHRSEAERADAQARAA